MQLLFSALCFFQREFRKTVPANLKAIDQLAVENAHGLQKEGKENLMDSSRRNDAHAQFLHGRQHDDRREHLLHADDENGAPVGAA